ncbi:MAG: 2-oxoisovalerate dehydrogenase component beta subunit, partial [Subtercola sp.]|nr:2-oxoisovalerate dehydrogenase component beta subunit [Subtercola sp.]
DLPLDGSRMLGQGDDAVLVAHGPSVALAQAAAAAAHEDGYSVGVLDLRSLSPLDLPALTNAAKQSGRVVVVHEASTFGGIGAEIAATITEHCFADLRSPVLRVGGYNMPYPPAGVEDQFLPDIDRVLVALDRSLSFEVSR